MKRFARLPAATFPPRLLLWLGCFAMALHLWAGTQLMGMEPAKVDSQGNFVAEICTALGIVGAQATPNQTTNQATNSPDAPASNSNTHDCCKLCVASAPLLLTSASLAVSPAPSFHVTVAASFPTRPASFVRKAHPPRGPPATVCPFLHAEVRHAAKTAGLAVSSHESPRSAYSAHCQPLRIHRAGLSRASRNEFQRSLPCLSPILPGATY